MPSGRCPFRRLVILPSAGFFVSGMEIGNFLSSVMSSKPFWVEIAMEVLKRLIVKHSVGM